jgi:cyclopropane fatty-acyl-phospholipid synthase-like methyltransferase
MSMMNKLTYEILYRFPFVPISWIMGPILPDLVKLVEGGRLTRGRAIDLGCGVGVEAIYLAQNGFDVTGVDFSPTAIRRARRDARDSGVEVNFIQDDLTDLQHVSGTFDLLIDVGAFSDLDQVQRDAYVQSVLPLSHSGSHYLLMCFENKLEKGELDNRFVEQFSIETISGRTEMVTSRSVAVFLMTRR